MTGPDMPGFDLATPDAIATRITTEARDMLARVLSAEGTPTTLTTDETDAADLGIQLGFIATVRVLADLELIPGGTGPVDTALDKVTNLLAFNSITQQQT